MKDGAKSNTRSRWGNPAETVAYGKRTAREVGQRYGGDTSAVSLAGFSCGAVAGHYIGLRDLPERAKLRAWLKSVLKEYPYL